MEAKVSVLMQKYELGKMLGQGTFAKVYHARNLETGMSVAIKVIDKEKILKVGMVDQIQREILVMKLVRHPNIVELYEVMASKKKIYFVMEYIKGGELFNKVTRGKLKEEAARKYFKHLINGVDFCHSRSVYHRDLKPENLLIDEYGNLKISDFGLSTFVELKHDDGLLHTTCGTPAYVAPEVINRRGYDGAKSDIWSCGVILFVLLCGYLPFHDPNLMEMYRKINNSEFKFPNWVAPDARRLISKMLDPNPSTRISTSKIMESSWFRRGSQSKAMKTDENEFMESLVDGAEGKGKPGKPTNLNAFDIIALSTGFDLSGLFEGNNEKKDFKFTSNQPANTIFSKLEELAKSLKLKVTKKNGGLVKLEGSKEGRKGLLSIEAEIFEFSSEFHLVELKKSNGDTLEYQKIMEEEIRPSLKDVVWSWQGDDPRSQQNVSQLAAK